jgi:hypothetical protein
VHELIGEVNPHVNGIILTITITAASGTIAPRILPPQSASPDTRAVGATAFKPAFQLTTPRAEFAEDARNRADRHKRRTVPTP